MEHLSRKHLSLRSLKCEATSISIVFNLFISGDVAAELITTVACWTELAVGGQFCKVEVLQQGQRETLCHTSLAVRHSQNRWNRVFQIAHPYGAKVTGDPSSSLELVVAPKFVLHEQSDGLVFPGARADQNKLLKFEDACP